MSIGYLRRWSDPGAPKLWANQFGSFPNLLKAVLVDGYGDTPGLGWTHEYSSPCNNIMVFRNNPFTGSGIYLRVANSNLYSSANFARVSMFESMIDWDNGLLRTPPVGSYLSWAIGNSASATCVDGIHWMIVGDEKGFWFCVRAVLATSANIFASLHARSWTFNYVGDILPIHPGHPYPTILFGNLNSDSFPVEPMASTSSFKTIRSAQFIVRGSTFNPGCVNVGIGSGSSYESSNLGTSPEISPIYGRNLLSPITVHDTRQLIGFLPGGRNVLRRSGTEEGAEFDEEYVKLDKILHILLYRSSNQTTGQRIGIVSGEGFRNVF